MLQVIFHQIWNQRRMNGWIFTELLIVSFFLWVALDPICVLTSTRNIAPGYEAEGRYVVRLSMYESTHGKYDAEAEANDSMKVEHYNRVARVIRDLPEVESLAIPRQLCFPGSTNWSGARLYRDTADVAEKNYGHMQWYSFVKGTNPSVTYGMKDAITDGPMNIVQEKDGIYISENLAIELFGTTDARGKVLYQNANLDSGLEVLGVFADYKHFDYTQPYALAIYFEKEIEASQWMSVRYPFVFKLKEGVDEEAFVKRFADEIGPTLEWGNIYFDSIRSFREVCEDKNNTSGIYNKIRMHYALAGFAVLCVFLGMLGTFWMRSNARRQEIGVMRSMGASRNDIIMQYLMEAAILVTLAFVCSLPALLHYVHEVGLFDDIFAALRPIISDKYWVNNFWQHFGVVSLITYLLILGVSLVGTLIPVLKAANILPADALRDE